MRVKAEVRKEVKIKEGDRVKVKISVRDHSTEAAAIPKDLRTALREEGVLKNFEAMPPGKRAFLIRKINEVAKAETREKRIYEAVKEAHLKKLK